MSRRLGFSFALFVSLFTLSGTASATSNATLINPPDGATYYTGAASPTPGFDADIPLFAKMASDSCPAGVWGIEKREVGQAGFASVGGTGTFTTTELALEDHSTFAGNFEYRASATCLLPAEQVQSAVHTIHVLYGRAPIVLPSGEAGGGSGESSPASSPISSPESKKCKKGKKLKHGKCVKKKKKHGKRHGAGTSSLADGGSSNAHISYCDLKCTAENEPGAFTLTRAQALEAAKLAAPLHLKESGPWCEPAYPDCSALLRSVHRVQKCGLPGKPNYLGLFHCLVEVETCYGHAYPTPAQPEGITNCKVYTEYEARVAEVQVPRLYRKLGLNVYLQIDGKKRRVSVGFLSH